MKKDSTENLVIVTGLSGAGISSALKHLEDLGYEVFDNFPVPFLNTLLEQANERKPIAVGMDSRTRGFDFATIRDFIIQRKARLVFLTCDEEILQKRFTETRRRHPLASDRPVSAGIKEEQALLYPLREIADPVIDTSELSIHDLRHVLETVLPRQTTGRLVVTVQSFGFKNGLPRDADIVMDVRFLKNPHWEADLRALTGRDRPVQSYIENDPAFSAFLQNFKAMLEPLLDRYRQEGKSYLTIGFGCTGGRHRSVYMVEKMADWLRQKPIMVVTRHRDLDRS
jgi:UPF0042 nucleotide-binding protein